MIMTTTLSTLSAVEREKLIADKFYCSLAQSSNDYAQLVKSGWVNHRYSHPQMLELYRQSIDSHPIAERRAGEAINILFTTGSFAPLHLGHIEMLQRARQVLYEAGIKVDKVIVSASHDQYVLYKNESTRHWPIERRIERIRELIKDEAGFSLDRWESQICEAPVNFTDVLCYLETYFLRCGFARVNLYYVFGSDNIEFARCFNFPQFVGRYGGVCVQRSQAFIDSATRSKMGTNIFFTQNLLYPHLSSTWVRNHG